MVNQSTQFNAAISSTIILTLLQLLWYALWVRSCHKGARGTIIIIFVEYRYSDKLPDANKLRTGKRYDFNFHI